MLKFFKKYQLYILGFIVYMSVVYSHYFVEVKMYGGAISATWENTITAVPASLIGILISRKRQKKKDVNIELSEEKYIIIL